MVLSPCLKLLQIWNSSSHSAFNPIEQTSIEHLLCTDWQDTVSVFKVLKNLVGRQSLKSLFIIQLNKAGNDNFVTGVRLGFTEKVVYYSFKRRKCWLGDQQRERTFQAEGTTCTKAWRSETA